MKTHLFTLVCMIFATVAVYGQNPVMDEKEYAPSTTIGEKYHSVDEYLQKAVNYPMQSFPLKHQGTVVIGFVVTAMGDLKDITVINSVSYEADREVIRALKSTRGKWTPGLVEGKPVEVMQEVAVVFKPYPEDNFIAIARTLMQKGNQKLFVKN